MSWIYYLLEANFYLAVFYALYYFIFRRETWYQLNRAYLLVSSVVSFVIPFMQLGFLRAVPQTVQQITIEPVAKTIATKTAAVVVSSRWDINDYMLTTYLFIAFTLLINLSVKIIKLINLSRKQGNRNVGSYKLIETDGEPDAFSFFSYLFINPQLLRSQTVIHHELVHIKQRHSWDIIFIEAIKILNWFNPVVYLLQYSVKELHEFIADSETAKAENNTAAYTDFLVNSACCGLAVSSLTSTFFNRNLLKNRIIMLHQKPSGSLARLKYLITLPLCAALLCASTLAFSKSYGVIDLAPGHKLAAKIKINDANVADPLDPFYNYLGRYIRYPADAHNSANGGLLTVTFKVDTAGKIQEISTSGKLFDSIKKEATRVLQIADVSLLKPGVSYTLPIRFLVVEKGTNITNADIKKLQDTEPVVNDGTERLKEVVVSTFL